MRYRSLIVVSLVLAVSAACPASSHALMSTGDGSWFWRSPQPEGCWLNAICHAGNQLVAVGDGGVILTSSDDGVSWQAHPSGTWLSLNGVSFPEASDGWAVGGTTGLSGDLGPSGTVILHTADGGLTWTSQHLPVSAPLSAVCFTDASTGWAVGDRGTVLHTSDGGLTWRRQTAPTPDDLTCVVFHDSRHGWIGGVPGAVLVTSDGGQHWRRVALGAWAHGFELTKPAFADSRHGVAIVMDPNAWSDNGSGMTLAATSDGGLHWHPLAVPAGIEYQAVAFDSQGTLWANAIDTTGNTMLFVRTPDGGHSWSREYVDIVTVQAMAAAPSGGLCAVGGGILTRSPQGPWLPHSTWWETPTQLQMFDDHHGVGILSASMTGSGKTDFLTTSDGINWQTVASLPQQIATLAFVDPQNGWVIGDSGISGASPGIVLHTSDGGHTWHDQSGPLRKLILFNASFADAAHGWVCAVEPNSARFLLYHTADGGQTWHRQTVPAGLDPLSADFISAQEGWIGGLSDNGAVTAHTVDGGAHWATSSTKIKNLLVRKVSFIDSSHGWAIAYTMNTLFMSSMVLVTSDGGQTWTEQGKGSSLTQYTLSDLAFVDALHGWVFAGSYDWTALGGAWQTSDGGKTWTAVQTGTGMYGLTSCSVANGVVYAVGPNGFLSTLDRTGDTAAPSTYDDFDGRYHRHTVAVHLYANDIGGGTVAATQYRIDGDPTWHDYSGSIVFAAPANHSGDGRHTLTYRSIDTSGNVEPDYTLTVPIDTLGPTTKVLAPVRVVRGNVAMLRFRAFEKTSPSVDVRIRIRDAKGRCVKTLTLPSVQSNSVLYPGFRCWLAPGRYVFTVYARDMAGNVQVRAGRGLLVVRPGKKASPEQLNDNLYGPRLAPGASASRTKKSVWRLVGKSIVREY